MQLIGIFPVVSVLYAYLNINKDRRIGQFKLLANSRTYDIDTFITCTSQNVVYLLICTCGLQYVGRTVRAINVRIKVHVANIKKGFPKHSLSKHLECHVINPDGTTFIAINRFMPHWRGNFVRHEISRIETGWIYELKCYVPFSLNIDWDVNGFIDNS